MIQKRYHYRIQKRYQYRSNKGIIWTNWFNTFHNAEELEHLQIHEKYQEHNKLLNEFRIINL